MPAFDILRCPVSPEQKQRALANAASTTHSITASFGVKRPLGCAAEGGTAKTKHPAVIVVVLVVVAHGLPTIFTAYGTTTLATSTLTAYLASTQP